MTLEGFAGNKTILSGSLFHIIQLTAAAGIFVVYIIYVFEGLLEH